jgi:signal transduction histidine kinase
MFNGSESLTKVRVTIQAEEEFGEVPVNVQFGLYRIAQEALHNVWKHSGEKEAVILFTRVDESVHMKSLITASGLIGAFGERGRLGPGQHARTSKILGWEV